MESPTQATDTDSIIASISRLADELATGSNLTTDQEKHLRAVCQKVLSGLRKSSLQVEFPEKTAIKIALDMGVFDFVCGSDRDEFTVNEIAKHTSADPVLVERIMRALVLSRLFSPTSRDTYKANRSVQNLAPGAHMRDMVNFTHDVADSTLLKLPEFLAKNKYRNPDRADATAFQHAHQTDEPFYNWLQRRSSIYSAFCGMMKSTEDFAARWPDLFPVCERFHQFRQPHAQQTLKVVDIAGGTGHNMQRLVDRMPGLKGDLILQDHAEVLANRASDLDARIRGMPHNFFDAQPVKGADVYALTRVLHNWPDQECRRILEHIAIAMTHDSILLIGDKVFPTGAAEVSAADVMADMSMMMLLGGMERTEAQFRQLLSSVGLEVVRIWRSPGPIKNHEGLLEVKLADGAKP
ncbi:S-adenosyl-L-methionine-dependent methyltransferase [Aspergillus venezuelensis]